MEQLLDMALSITMSLPSPRGERERERSRGTAFEACGLQNKSELRFRAHMRLRAGPSSDFERQYNVLERPLQQRFLPCGPPTPCTPAWSTTQNPICGTSNAEMEPTYNINDRLRHMGRHLPTYPRRPFWGQPKAISYLWEIESTT